MAGYNRDTHSPHTNYADARATDRDSDDARLGDLLRRFTQDASTLVQHEIALAKLELRENVKDYARDTAKIGVALVIAMFGGLALLAFAVVGLGSVIDNYWLSALIVALLLLAVAGVLARAGLRHMKRNHVAPEATVASLEADKQLLKHEARDLQRKLRA